MSPRPKRDRKPTQPFEYHNSPAQSRSSHAGYTSSPKKSTASSGSKVTSNRGVRGGRGSIYRGRGRGAARGRGRGRGGARNGSSTDNPRHSAALDSDGPTEDRLLSSDPVEDDGALANDPGDPDYEKEPKPVANKRLQDSPAKRTALRRRKPPTRDPVVVAPHQRDEDEIIEQWYADPYERINPNDVVYDQWRLKNLHTLLHTQGYSIFNAKHIAAWLMKCNGHFKEYNPPVQKSRAKAIVQSCKEATGNHQHRVSISDVDVHEDDDGVDNDAEDYAASTQELDMSQPEQETTYAAFQAAMLSLTENRESSIDPSEKENLDKITSTKADHSSQSSFEVSDVSVGSLLGEKDKHGRRGKNPAEYTDTIEASQRRAQELNDQLKLDNLKRCLNVFHAVYGPGGPKSEPGKYEHNYFSRPSKLPTLVPKAGLRTQGHFPLQTISLPSDHHVFSNDAERGASRIEQAVPFAQGEVVTTREVFTEDRDFGLTKFRRSERATKADMEMYYAQFDRVRAARLTQSRLGNTTEPTIKENTIEAGPIDLGLDFDHDHNIDLERLEQEELTKEITHQINQKVFDWETPQTMSGFAVPSQSKSDPVLRPGQFALREHHTWKDLRRRQNIIAQGGEEAARLLEQEYENHLAEDRREKRRRENARTLAKRRATREGTETDEGRARKRVKFLEGVEEEW